jgi:membrane-associated protein
MQILDYFFHLDRYLNQWADALGLWLYLILFIVIFCETGLVVTPFLPGDSLLFAVGALAAGEGSPLSLPLLVLVLWAAAAIGDAANYSIGYRVGPKVFTSETSRFLNKKYLVRTQRFYEKHGGKTIVLARFIPFVRTFAPFVAGIGQMRYLRFAVYNVTGGLAWVLLLLLAGYFLHNVPGVKGNFQYVILAIIFISVLPVVIEFWRARREVLAAQSPAHPASDEPREPLVREEAVEGRRGEE